MRNDVSSSSLSGYTIRESARARHVRLQITPDGEVLVVLPQGYPRARIPSLLESHRDWVARALARHALQHAWRKAAERRPGRIAFPAIDQEWSVDWQHDALTKRCVVSETGSTLNVRGDIEQADLWQDALRRWVVQQGRLHLIPWLEACAQSSVGHRPQRVTIRCQKSRWGSCSSSGAISLNAQLLFLSPPLVRYVLHHELCHLVRPDHSQTFWHLLEQREPETVTLRRELRQAERRIPGWLRLASRSPRQDAGDA
jgi:predicted metal-dependent hydrolase